MRGRNIKAPATYKAKNEPTRQFEAIMAEREDPDYKSKQKILETRKDRADKSDIGL